MSVSFDFSVSILKSVNIKQCIGLEKNKKYFSKHTASVILLLHMKSLYSDKNVSVRSGLFKYCRTGLDLGAL